MNCRHYILIILFLTLPAAIYAQQDAISYSFMEDTVATGYGQTFFNRLQIKNYTNQTLILYNQSSNDIRPLISLPDSIRLYPHQSQILPVKYLSSANTIKSAIQPITVSLKTKDNLPVPESATFYVSLIDPERIGLSPVEPVAYIDPETDMAVLKVRCTNEGYVSTILQLTATAFPQGLNFTESKQVFELAPGEQQIILFKAHNLLQKHFAQDFTVNIQLANANGINLNTCVVKVITLTSDKRLTVGNNPYANLLNNVVEVDAVNSNNNPSYLQLHANGRINITDSARLLYNVNANYYTQKVHGFEVYDSWLGFSNNNFAVRAGNIYENLDYSLYGRGAKASYFLNKKNDIDVYYVNNNYLLFSQINSSQQGANVWAGSYTYHASENSNGKISFIHSTDPRTHLLINMATAQSRIKLGKENFLDLVGGYSHENVEGHDSTGKYGYSGGFIYTARFDKWNIALNNYLSSAYYSGLRRGATQLDERIEYHFSKTLSTYIRYNKTNNTPKYLPELATSNGNYNNTSTYEIGMNKTIKHNLFFCLKPYLFTQSLEKFYIAGQTIDNVNAFSPRVALDARYAKAKNSVSLTVDYGYTRINTAGVIPDEFQSARIVGNYTGGIFGFNAFVQKGPYYLSDASGQEPDKFKLYSFGPDARLSIADNKLTMYAGYNLNYNSLLSNWGHTVNGQVKYIAGGSWELSAQVLYNNYNHAGFIQTRIGIVKKFAQANTPGLKKLTMNFFGDENANGVWDAGEKALPNVIVDVAGSVAVSDRKGKVSYTNVPVGEQNIQLMNGKEWYMMQALQLSIKQNKKINVPLVRSGRIAGRIEPVQQKYETRKVLLEGIRVIATDSANHNYSTITDEDGNFSFSLPLNHYTLHVASEGLNFAILNGRQEVTLEKDLSEKVIFNLVDKTRQVEVKRF